VAKTLDNVNYCQCQFFYFFMFSLNIKWYCQSQKSIGNNHDGDQEDATKV